MEKKQQKTNKQLLRIAYPNLYRQLMETLSKHHIHSYDVQATAHNCDNRVEIQVRFGEDFNQEHSRIFQKKNINEKNDQITNFFNEVGETCKEMLIADYFKMVKP